MTQEEFTIENNAGLHARPAALFVETAARFESVITIENLATTSKPVNAKSILSLMTSGVEHGHRIRITADGADESDALQALHQLIEGNFGEKLEG